MYDFVCYELELQDLSFRQGEGMKGFSHGGYTRRVCSPLKETNLGVALAFFDP